MAADPVNPTFIHLEDKFVAGRLKAITKSDSVILDPCFVYVGGAGDIALVACGDYDGTAGENAVTLVGVPGGTLLPIKVRQVLSTGTTATSLVAVR